MFSWMVHIELPQEKPSVFWEKLPAHRQKVNQMLNSGTIQLYSVTDDLLNVYAVMEAQSEWEVKNLVGSFPLFPFYSNVRIKALRFHEKSKHEDSYLYMN